MKKLRLVLGAVAAAVTLLSGGVAQASLIQSATATLGGTTIDFEGQAEGQIISNQYGGSGVLFSQVDGGTPQIDNASFLFGYNASSGTGVLTGSTNGGAQFPTVAGLVLTFVNSGSALEFWLGDTAPLGTYTIQAFDSTSALIESFSVTSGSFVGFFGLTDLKQVTIDSSVDNDAFAIDDVRLVSNNVPEPTSLALLGLGLAGFGFARRKAKH